MKLRQRKDVSYAGAPLPDQPGSGILQSGDCAATDVLDDIEDVETGASDRVLDDISADSSDEEGRIGVATSGGKVKPSRKGRELRASKKVDEHLTGLQADSLLRYAKPGINNAADPASEVEDTDSDDSAFQVSHRKSVFISRKRKVLAHPGGEQHKSREGLRDSRPIRYKDMSSSDDENGKDLEEGHTMCMQEDEPTPAKMSTLGDNQGQTRKADGQVYYTRRARKKDTLPSTTQAVRKEVQAEDCADKEKGESVKQYRRLRKKVGSPLSDHVEDFEEFAHDRKVRQRNRDTESMSAELHEGSSHAAPSSPLRRQPSRACARKQVVDNSADEWHYPSEDDAEVKPPRAGKGKGVGTAASKAAGTASMLDKMDQSDEMEALPYSVGQYGLCTTAGDYPASRKRIFGTVEKVLSVRNVAGNERVFCVKEHDRSYRAVLFVTEKLLQHHSPQLLRNFLKRMHSLGRADGHDGDDEKGPAFDPRFIEVDRIFGFQVKASKKSYYVKWRNLPYSESTWEDESSLRYDRNAIRRYLAIDKPGTRCDAWKSMAAFRDGRTLRDYQEEGVNWLDREYENKTNCILADEMGLGKTIQSVAMLENLRSKRRKKGPFLVVAPVSTLGHWLRELQSLTDMNCIVYGGNPEDRQIIREHEFYCDGTKRAKFHVLLTSFEILLKDQTVLSKQDWDYVIIDEAHRLKAKDSKTTSAVKFVIKNVDEGGLLLLTGTPVQNNMKEIFGLLSLLDPVNFASEDTFLSKYGDLKDAEQVKELQDLILRPRLLRRLKEDVEKSIPQKEETIIWVELTKDQRVYYKAIYENAVPQLLKGSQAANMSSLRNVAMELRKVCNHPFLCTGLEQDLVWKHQKSAEPEGMLKLLRESSGKMVLVDKLLPSLKEAGRRVLIFSQFTSMLDLLEDYLVSRKYSFERIDGKIRGTDRQAAIDRYSAKGSDIFVFLLSTRAGGLGITLTAADTCIIYDSDWNPQNDLQAMARCHRIGQTKDVRIYRLITRKTYEQQLFECSSKKYGLDEAILGNRLGADADQAQMQNIENLLKNGAYDFLKDDGEEEAAAFSAENIDQILEQRTQKRLIGGSGCNTFSVATFDANEKGEDTRLEHNPLEQATERFWHELLPEAYEAAKTAKASKASKAANALQEVPIGRRRRARIDYAEHRQTSDDEGADGQKRSAEAKKIIPVGDAAGLPTSSLDSEEGVEQWTELELKHLEERMMSLGRNHSRAEQIQGEARLENHHLDEVKEVMEAIISYCESVRDGIESMKDDNVKDLQNCVRQVDHENKAQGPRNLIPSMPACIEKAMSSGVVIERLKKNSIRLLDRIHERTVLENFLSSNQPLPANLPRKNKLPQWWGDKQDLDLLRGALRHGHSKFKKMKMDNTLCFHLSPSSKLDSKASLSGEDGQEIDSWPSDAVLTSRLRRLIEALPNGVNQRVLKRKAAEVEARSEQRNQKLASKLDAHSEKDNQKKPLKMALPMEGTPENPGVRDVVGNCAAADDEKLVLKKAKAMELKHERQMQLKASQWQNSIRDALIRENALREAQIQSALERECATTPAANQTTPSIQLDTKNCTDLQFAEYEAATERAMTSSDHVDKRGQQENHSASSPDLKQLNQAAPLMGMKQLVRHVSPSPYVKDREDLAITALPPERPVSKEEVMKGSQCTSFSMMTDTSNKENEIPHRKKLSLPRDSHLKSKISHKQQTLLSFLTKTAIN